MMNKSMINKVSLKSMMNWYCVENQPFDSKFLPIFQGHLLCLLQQSLVRNLKNSEQMEEGIIIRSRFSIQSPKERQYPMTIVTIKPLNPSRGSFSHIPQNTAVCSFWWLRLINGQIPKRDQGAMSIPPPPPPPPPCQVIVDPSLNAIGWTRREWFDPMYLNIS